MGLQLNVKQKVDLTEEQLTNKKGQELRDQQNSANLNIGQQPSSMANNFTQGNVLQQQSQIQMDPNTQNIDASMFQSVTGASGSLNNMSPSNNSSKNIANINMADSNQAKSEEQIQKEKKKNKLQWLIIGGAVLAVLIIAGVILFASLNNEDDTPVQETQVARQDLNEEEYTKKVAEVDNKILGQVNAEYPQDGEFTKETASKLSEHYKSIGKAIDDALVEWDKYNPPEKYKEVHKTYIKFLQDISTCIKKVGSTASMYTSGSLSNTAFKKEISEEIVSYNDLLNAFKAYLDKNGVTNVFPLTAFTKAPSIDKYIFAADDSGTADNQKTRNEHNLNK